MVKSSLRDSLHQRLLVIQKKTNKTSAAVWKLHKKIMKNKIRWQQQMLHAESKLKTTAWSKLQTYLNDNHPTSTEYDFHNKKGCMCVCFLLHQSWWHFVLKIKSCQSLVKYVKPNIVQILSPVNASALIFKVTTIALTLTCAFIEVYSWFAVDLLFRSQMSNKSLRATNADRNYSMLSHPLSSFFHCLYASKLPHVVHICCSQMVCGYCE